MRQKIRVRTNNSNDSKGESVLFDIQTRLHLSTVKKIETASVYRFDGISKKEAKILAERLLCEPINQKFTLNEFIFQSPTHVIEIAYKPGVMNSEIASIIKSARDLGINPTFVESSREYGFYGDISREEIEQMIKRLNLFNTIVEYIRYPDDPITTIPIMTMTEQELMLLSKDKLFLNLEEMKVIQKYFKKIGRNPIDCELETIAQTWSEHCAHKTFKANVTVDGKKKKPFMKRIKDEALKHDKHIVSAFIDNSGVMDFYEGWAISGKGETHNSPSAIEPYGGAMTGSGGVFRDVLGTGQGAKNIVSTDIFCFAPPGITESKLPLGCLPPDYLLKRVVTGVRDYGNRIGIPTNNGSIHFHDDFRAKPTVLVGAYGILPKKLAQKGKVRKGDIVVCIGGKTGRDGIHGATFSSGEMTDRTISVNSSAVQIGNAIEEKRMFDALLEARDQGLIQAMQDCGAGGFSSAIGELGEETGVTVHLEKAPLKYEGLYPWEIWVSESQERMVVATSKNKLAKLLSICKKYNVEATVLGTCDGSKRLRLFYEEEIVCDLDMEFLHHGLPQRNMLATRPQYKNTRTNEKYPSVPNSQKEWITVLEKVVSHGNVCSKEPIVRLYDHSVQGTNDLQPYSGVNLDAPNDAVVIRPMLDKSYGMIVSHGLNPVLNIIDPYKGSLWAATEALANYVSAGGNYKEASLINNYIWPFPDEESLWSLDRSVDAVVDVMKLFAIPVISGKDSLSSTYRGKDGQLIKIPPVLCISVFGRIPDASKTVSTDFKKKGSTIYLIGKQDTDTMGGSIYYDIHGVLGSDVPQTDLSQLPETFTVLYNLIQGGKLLSSHDISEGGLITTLFEMGLGGDMGVDISIPDKEKPDHFLFNETAGCFVIEVENEQIGEVIFKNVPHIKLGKTKVKKTITTSQNKQLLFEVPLMKLREVWQEPMKKVFP